MYAYTFKHIDSRAYSIEIITCFQICLKQRSALADFKKVRKDAGKLRNKWTKN